MHYSSTAAPSISAIGTMLAATARRARRGDLMQQTSRLKLIDDGFVTQSEQLCFFPSIVAIAMGNGLSATAAYSSSFSSCSVVCCLCYARELSWLPTL